MPRNMRKGLYRVIYLVKGQRAAVPATLQFDAAMREFARLKRRGFTAWIETDSGEFVPVEGAMRKPKEIVDEQRRHRVADFSTLPELIEHAKTTDGATHILVLGRLVKLYFPTSDGRYEEGVVWQQNGYWHAPAQSARTVVSRLPAGADPIGSHTQRVGRRAGEARVNPTITRIVIAEVPSRGKPLFTMKVYDENGHLRSGISTPSSLDYVKKKADEWFPGVPVEMALHEGVTEAPRRRLSRPNLKMTPESALQLAGELSQAVGGSKPRTLPGGYRWSEQNESAQFTTYSPEYNQKVVVVVSIFADGSAAVDFFGDEGTSETARYENVGHFTYSSRTDLPEMVKDIDWVWKTVDGYAASWQEDEGSEVDEAGRTKTASMYQEAKVFINSRFQVGFTFTPQHGPYDAARTVLQHARSGDVIEVKQDNEVWTYDVTRQPGKPATIVERIESRVDPYTWAEETGASSSGLIAVRLDDPHFGSGPGTVTAHPKSVDDYNKLITDRDGARDPRMRLWRGDAPIGARVSTGTSSSRVNPLEEARRVEMPRPVVSVTITDSTGTVVHSEIKSAFNSGIRASEAAVRKIALSEHVIYDGEKPSRTGDVYTRRWISRKGDRILVATIEKVERNPLEERRDPSFKRVGSRVKYNYTGGPVPPGTQGTIIGFLPRSYQAQIRWDDESVSSHTPDEYDVVSRGTKAQ